MPSEKMPFSREPLKSQLEPMLANLVVLAGDVKCSAGRGGRRRDLPAERAAVPSRFLEPRGPKARFEQPLPDIGVLPHHFPYQFAAVILDHRDDRSLIDA